MLDITMTQLLGRIITPVCGTKKRGSSTKVGISIDVQAIVPPVETLTRWHRNRRARIYISDRIVHDAHMRRIRVSGGIGQHGAV